MGRAPCCDKANVKKGPWSPEEDAKLKSYIEQHGTGGNWIALPQKIGLRRCGKSCRLRWLNYLRPNIKHGGFSEDEDSIICSLYFTIGSRWSIIAAQLPGRTDNDIKNYWNTRLKKRLLGKQRKEQLSRRGGGTRCFGDGFQKPDQMKFRGTTKAEESFLSGSTVINHHQGHLWSQMPALPHLPYSSCLQEPTLNDYSSIRKLLAKLGGRFSCDGDDNKSAACCNLLGNYQFPADVSAAAALQQTPDYEPSLNMLSASSSIQNSYAHVRVEGEGVHLPQERSFASELKEMLYRKQEYTNGGGMVNYKTGLGKEAAAIGDNMDWGEMMISTLMAHNYPHQSSNYGDIIDQEYANVNQL